MGNKAKTMDAIADTCVRLMQENDGVVPTAREISKVTGFSAGTVYLHFGAIGGLIRYIVRARMSTLHHAVEALIAAHDPKTNPSVLLDQIVDHLFAELQKFNPTIIRKVYQIALNHADRISDLDQAGDGVLAELAVAIARDETGTFKQVPIEELALVSRGLQAIVRSPLMERNRIFGTPAHVNFVRTYMRKMLLNEVLQKRQLAGE